MGEFVCYNLKIDKVTWSNFKKTMNKEEIINDIILDLIKQRIEDFKKNKDLE